MCAVNLLDTAYHANKSVSGYMDGFLWTYCKPAATSPELHCQHTKKPCYTCNNYQEEFEDTKGVIRIRRRTDNTMAKRKITKGQNIFINKHIE